MQRKRQITVTLRKRVRAVRDDKSCYGEGMPIVATVQPLNGVMAAQMYGDRLGMTKLLLTDPGSPIVEGMGACVDVPPEAEPDYKVMYVAGWAKHTVAHIQFIPEEERVQSDED